MDNEIIRNVGITLWTTSIFMNVSPYWCCYKLPFARLDVLQKIRIVAFFFHVDTCYVVSPRAEFHCAVLRVKREVLDVDFAFTAKHYRGQPHVLAVVIQLDTRGETVEVPTKVNRFIRASYVNRNLIDYSQFVYAEFDYASLQKCKKAGAFNYITMRLRRTAFINDLPSRRNSLCKKKKDN